MRAYIEADPEIFEDKTKYVEGWGWDHTKWLLEEWPTYVGVYRCKEKYAY